MNLQPKKHLIPTVVLLVSDDRAASSFLLARREVAAIKQKVI